MKAQKASVQVAIVTELKSPDLPDSIFSVIEQLDSEHHTVDEVTVIVNRDPRQMAPAQHAAIGELLELSPRVKVGHEVRRGIPYARNKALNLWASSESEWLAFVDDDCIVEPGWLRTQLATAKEFDADASSSMWILEPVGAPSSFLPSEIWEKRTYRNGLREAGHGEFLRHAYTRGVVFSGCKDLVAQGLLKFDESRVTLGGSDVLFFEDFRRSGGKIVLAGGPLVKEKFRGERLTLKWHFFRKVRNIQFIVERSRRGEIIELWATPLNLVSWLLLTLVGARAVLVRREKKRKLNLSLPSPATIGRVAFRLAQLWGIFSLLVGRRYHSYSDSSSGNSA